MTILTVDERRRLTLPKRLIDKKGQKFVAVDIPQGILLKPLPKDPIAALQQEGKKLEGYTREQLRQLAYEAAHEEVDV